MNAIYEKEKHLTFLQKTWYDSQSAYADYIMNLFDKFELEVVVYDEFEKFSSYDSDQFGYPY